jgi:hypothetical protein
MKRSHGRDLRLLALGLCCVSLACGEGVTPYETDELGGTRHTTVAPTTTGHPYYPLKHGSYIKYKVFEIRGAWDNRTMHLSISSRTPHANSPQMIRATVGTCAAFGNGPIYSSGYHSYNHHQGVWRYKQSLRDGGARSSDGIQYIGEAVNHSGGTHVPFIAKIALAPQPGQVIDEASRVTASSVDCQRHDGGQVYDPAFRWTYKTLRWYPRWGRFNDCWRTALREMSPDGGIQQVYNYVFMRNVGMVQFWYIDPTTGKGFEYYATDWGLG